MKKALSNVKQYLLSGVSFAIPFIAGGGILIAIAIMFAPMTATGPDFSNSPMLKTLLDIGVASFSFLVPVLAGYIAYSMGDRPALVPGFVGGSIAATIGAGFLGGIVAGLIAGYVVMLIKKAKVPKYIRPIMPILVIPALSSVVVGFVMYKVIGLPIRDAMQWMTVLLTHMGQGSQVLLALILGAMIAFDMGGPMNKVAFFFSSALIASGNYAPMGACAAAICIPPLGLGLATKIGKKLWSDQEKEAGTAALFMGCMGITEGAIPFAAGDPLRVIPTIMVGSMVGAVIAMLSGVGDHAPHGGLIVTPVVDNKIMFLIAIIAGVITTALLINALKKYTTKKA